MRTWLDVVVSLSIAACSVNSFTIAFGRALPPKVIDAATRTALQRLAVAADRIVVGPASFASAFACGAAALGARWLPNVCAPATLVSLVALIQVLADVVLGPALRVWLAFEPDEIRFLIGSVGI